MGNKTITLERRIAALSLGQRVLLDAIVATFEQPVKATSLASSDVVDPGFLSAFGDMLKLHHTLSNDYLDKHRFEAVVERVYKALGRDAFRSGRNHPGHDITVDGVKWSLKTQGDANIKCDSMHISKFMELGKGKWEDEGDLPGLRDGFLKHMRAYQRIFQLRYFKHRQPDGSSTHFYELVEIPLSLLKKAKGGQFEMKQASRQSPKPGYCTVFDRKGVMFRLYFDGGSERKLQIKDLRKNLCQVHATWEF